MDKEQQRIAIAEACGWTNIHTCTCGSKQRGTSPDGGHEGHLPDYLADLNAAYALCELLSADGWSCVISRLSKWKWECEFIKRGFDSAGIARHKAASDALSLAICEAFIRTLNLWTDE